MTTTLPQPASGDLSPETVVVLRYAKARAALASAERAAALRNLKRRLCAGMTLTDVHNTIDEYIADIEAAL